MESDSIVIVQFSVLHGDPRETSCLAHLECIVSGTQIPYVSEIWAVLIERVHAN